ncbi:MAG: OmpA family protein, partial [Collimonas sp.]|uniref:OmpA family protein n=1 Tax=Collimonas sp. TaxID=1963772 RepID=UPI00326326FE
PANPANVYVDGEFQTALLRGGYSSFCVAPGKHTLGAYMKDEPYYKGKTTDQFQAELAGGTLYFLKVREDGSSGAPLAVARAEAERELGSLRQQVHVLSRASAVLACDAKPAPAAAAAAAPAYKDYTLNGDVLFAFGKSDHRDMKVEGREEMAQLGRTLQRQIATVESVKVIGHADQIGSAAAALKLGAARAATVRRMLVENGVPANLVTSESVGNREPVVDDCKGSMQARIACNQPNRRVVVRVEGRHPG